MYDAQMMNQTNVSHPSEAFSCATVPTHVTVGYWIALSGFIHPVVLVCDWVAQWCSGPGSLRLHGCSLGSSASPLSPTHTGLIGDSEVV